MRRFALVAVIVATSGCEDRSIEAAIMSSNQKVADWAVDAGVLTRDASGLLVPVPESGTAASASIGSVLGGDSAADAGPLPPTPSTPPGCALATSPPVILGALPAEAVVRGLEERRGALQACWSFGPPQPGAPSRVTVKWVVNGEGRVTQAAVAAPSSEPRVDQCLVGLLKKVTFPAPKGGGIAVINQALTCTRR